MFQHRQGTSFTTRGSQAPNNPGYPSITAKSGARWKVQILGCLVQCGLYGNLTVYRLERSQRGHFSIPTAWNKEPSLLRSSGTGGCSISHWCSVCLHRVTSAFTFSSGWLGKDLQNALCFTAILKTITVGAPGIEFSRTPFHRSLLQSHLLVQEQCSCFPSLLTVGIQLLCQIWMVLALSIRDTQNVPIYCGCWPPLDGKPHLN